MNDEFLPARRRRRLPPRRRQDEYPPMFNLPPGVKSLILLLIAIHLGQHLMPSRLDMKLESALGYYPYRYWRLLHDMWGGTGMEVVGTPITYMFLHANWVHLGINVASLAAFGSQVERLAGARFMVVLFILCGVVGAFTQFAVNPMAREIIVGASAGISGLFAVAFMSIARQQGMDRRQVFAAICVILLITVATGIFGTQGLPIAWMSHIGGFTAGLLAEACLSRGGNSNPLRDLGWFVAIVSLPFLVVVVNISHYFQR